MMVPEGAQPGLERELVAMRPEIDPDFGARLDAWAEQGFPSSRELERRGAGPAPRRSGGLLRSLREGGMMAPALAGAALVVLMASVGTAALLSARDEIGSEKLGAGSATLEAVEGRGAAEAGAAAGDSSVVAPQPVPPTTGKLRPGQERIQERDAQMSLSTEPDQVDDVADGVVEVTERYDGIVASSNVSTGPDGGRATFDLRVPTQNLSAALSDLSDLASVTSRNEATADITEPYLTAQERFDEAEAEVDSLLSRLARADTSAEAAAVRAKLAGARAELAAARAQLGSEKQRARYSNLSLTVLGNGDADGWSLGDAADDAGSVVTDIAGALLVGMAAVVPLGLIAAAIWFGGSRLRRRSRERALDG